MHAPAFAYKEICRKSHFMLMVGNEELYRWAQSLTLLLSSNNSVLSILAPVHKLFPVVRRFTLFIDMMMHQLTLGIVNILVISI